MGNGCKTYLETQEHNKKYPKIRSIDPQERYDRVYGFMKRNSQQYNVEWSIGWHEHLIKEFSIVGSERKRFLDKIEQLKTELDEIKKMRIAMTLKVLEEMEKGIINNTTQGIWLSYPHTLEVTNIDENKDKYCIVHLCTGENFRGVRKWDTEPRNPRYSKVKLLEKI